MNSSKYISDLELQLIIKVANKLYEESLFDKDDLIDEQMLKECQDLLTSNDVDDMFCLCSVLETLHYCFSIILSEVRKSKREVITKIFEKDKKIAEEKKAIEKKLDSVPEYAELHYQEERLFQFLEHITNVKNNITWLTKDDEK